MVVFLDASEEYLFYPDLCFIPDKYDSENVAVGNTTRSVCSRLCSESYSLNCSAFLYDRLSHGCTLTSFTGESLEGEDTVSLLNQGCSGSSREFYRRSRHLGT